MTLIYTTEIFFLPKFIKIACRVMSVIMLGMAGVTFTQLSVSPVLIFIAFTFLFLAWSMFAYSRLHLIISDNALVFKGGLKPHDIDWKTIYKVDMQEAGKYDDLQTVVHYNDRKLKIAHSFYLKRQYKQILQLLEMKIAPELFTPKYYQLKEKRLKA